MTFIKQHCLKTHHACRIYKPLKFAGVCMTMHGVSYRLATNLENSGNLKNCQNLKEKSGKFEFLWVNLDNSGRM